MERFDIDNILQVTTLNTELEFERASSLYLKLRWMVKDDATLEPIRKYLKELIIEFEKRNWSVENEINDIQINENDKAIELISRENKFIQNRKEVIKEKLRENKLIQQDLGKILGHRKNYMSELINGVRPFSRDDLVVIHRILNIELKYLIPPFIRVDTAKHINKVLTELNRTRMKLNKTDLDFAM